MGKKNSQLFILVVCLGNISLSQCYVHQRLDAGQTTYLNYGKGYLYPEKNNENSLSNHSLMDKEFLMTDEDRLLSNLMRVYYPSSRPLFNASKIVTIKFSFALIQIYDMDERNQILTMNVWLEQVNKRNWS